jgi:hypothetical protein
MNIPLSWLPTVTSRGDASSLLSRPGDIVLVERGYPRLVVLACPCGCGEQLPVNLDPRAAPAWELYRGEAGASLYPSVWRESGCRSHFIVWRDQILLFGHWRRDLDEEDLEDERNLHDNILALLHTTRMTHFKDLAHTLGAVPWDVLAACRHLVRKGMAKEGAGEERGTFRGVVGSVDDERS